jgi:hypothetical protein
MNPNKALGEKGDSARIAAKLGAGVLGVDIASNLDAAANGRATDPGLANCTFQDRSG